MEFNQNLIFNFASIIATVLFLVTAGITIGRRLKLRWPVSVNCWFCNNDTKIYRRELNWWLCPNCKQYNGFTKDGDYAYDIPEQREQSRKNFAKSTVNRKAHDKKSLCDQCNSNEELKVAELRGFETKWFFDSRLKNLKKELESKYPLCERCRYLVDNVLRKQSTWLTQYKMLFYKQKSVNGMTRNGKKLDKALRIFLTMLTSAMMYRPNCWPLPLVGALLQTSAFVINQADKRTWDAVLTLLWICISLIGPANELRLMKYGITKNWPTLEAITEHQLVTALTLIIGITNIISRNRRANNLKASFKKLESPIDKKNSSSVANENFDDLDLSDKSETKNYSDYRQSAKELDASLPMKSFALTQNTRQHENQVPTSPSSPIIVNTTQEISTSDHRHFVKLNGNSEQYSLNESLSTLKTLTLGESRSIKSPKQCKIFETRVYGSGSPDLFQRSIKPQNRKFILAPAKLKSVAQTSWVAGGYWQLGVETPSLSRSSSQSSGFGSAGSNFGPSREPSVTKDVDKCSVVSDTQFCHGSRPNSPNSVTTCCRHPSPVHYNRCDSPMCNQTFGTPTNFSYSKNFQTHFSPVHPESTGCHDYCHTLQNRSFDPSMVQQNVGMTNFNNVQPTVLNSPIWLPVLLCGSLVFNMAVFCTILLR